MPKLSDDAWPAEDPALASFAEDLRILAGGPAPDPRPGLLAVMGQGVVHPTEPSTGRRRMLVKTLVGSLAAKVALGLGVATASVTAAGAAGVLPDPAQHAVASVVGATTPFSLPDPSEVTSLLEDDTSTSTTTTTLAGTSDEDDGTTGDDSSTGRAVNHGACVSAAARDKSEPGSHGKTVSSVARSDCGKTETTATTVTTVVTSTTSTTVPGGSTTTSTSVTSTSVPGEETSASSGPGRANSGRGNGGNSATGNGGTGNGGTGNGNSGSGGPGSSGKG